MEPGRYVLLIFVAVVLVGGLYYSYNRPADDQDSVVESRESNSRQQLSDFTFNETLADGEIWRLSAPRAYRYPDRIKLESPHVVYTVRGDTRLTIDAEHGNYRPRNQTLILKDNVVLRRVRQNQILRTNRLQWSRESELITTEKRVRLETPRGTLTARGMKTRLKEDTIQFLSDVKFSSP
jgi:LPS export ABC transporter protein LptC